MEIRYTKEFYKTKEEAQRNISKANWLSFDGNFDQILALYSFGHTLSLPGYETNIDTYIIDCDELNEEQLENLSSPFYLMDLFEELNCDSITVCDSASRKNNKKKLFVKGQFIRNIVDNEDVNYSEFVSRFEDITGIIVDKHQSKITQLTFGCYDEHQQAGSFAIAHDEILMKSISSFQPKKDEMVVKINSQNISSTHPMDICCENKNTTNKSTKDETNEVGASVASNLTITCIPTNQKQYNHHYGKVTRTEPRLDWNTHKFTKEGSQIVYIPVGSRDSMLGTIIKHVVLNAYNCNINHNERFDFRNIRRTVKTIINLQYEKSSQFIKEEETKINQECYNEWQHSQTMTLEEYYKEVCKKTGKKEKYKYTPRNQTLKQLFWDNITFFETCESREAVQDRIGNLCAGDVKLMNTMNKYYITYTRNAIKKTTKENVGRKKKDYSEMIKTMTKTEINKLYKNNKSFRKWYKENNIGE